MYKDVSPFCGFLHRSGFGRTVAATEPLQPATDKKIIKIKLDIGWCMYYIYFKHKLTKGVDMDLRKLMKEAGIGPTRLAELTGLSVPTVYTVLKDENAVELRTIKVIALFFGYSFRLEGHALSRTVYSIVKESGMSNKTIKDALSLKDGTKMSTIKALIERVAGLGIKIIKTGGTDVK